MIWLGWYVVAIVVLYRIYIVIYNLYIHPLRKVPGPVFYAVSWIPMTWRNEVLGRHWSDLKVLHEKYGDVVRTAPDEVSFTSASAWNAIEGTKNTAHQEFLRDKDFVNVFRMGNSTLLSVEREHHRAFRKILNPAFSDRTLAAQEPVMLRWADRFAEYLSHRVDQPVDINLCFNWATLDVMTELTFGMNTMPICRILLRFSVLSAFYTAVMALPVLQRWLQAIALSQERTYRRLDKDDAEPDVLSLIWNEIQREKAPVSKEQVGLLSNALCVAGSETTATLMAGVVWWLVNTPKAYERVTQEVRALKEAELVPKTLALRPYLNGCIQEGLRVHTPVALMVPRVVPKGGDWIDGYFLPGGTVVGVPNWAAANQSTHFRDPSKFLPERWISGENNDFAKDDKEVTQPFGKGQFGCLGKSLALLEARLFLAKLLWHFDVSMETREWISNPDANIRLLREPVPLLVKLKPVKRD